MIRLDRTPLWVRVWYRVPFLDRFAHAWLWRHGGFDVVPPYGPDGGGTAGVREPRRPHPPTGTLSAEAELHP